MVNNSLAPADMQTIEWFAENYSYDELKAYMPNSIPFKENLTVLAAKGLPVPVKTPGDVLRIVHYLSHGNSDLFIPPLKIRATGWKRGWMNNPERMTRRFKKFSRKERRYIMALLEDCAYPSEMVRNYMQWVRLGEIIHPTEKGLKEKYPKASTAFDKLRNTKIRSWYGHVDHAFKQSYKIGVQKLSERPGEFARRLDKTIRKASLKDRPLVLSKFREVAVDVSNKVLWELYEHFLKRNETTPRSVWIKGYRKPTVLKTLQPMNQELIDAIIDMIWGTFFDKFTKLETLGSIWLDPDLNKIPAPTNMRSLSEGLITVVKGQRNPIKADKKVLRCYVHWTMGHDLDLSVEFSTADGKKTDHIGFNNHPTYGVYTSGDVIPRGRIGRHAEYIDIVFDKIPFDYALMMINNFNGYDLNTSDAVMGFMERDSHLSGDRTWLPSSVTNAIKITAPCVRAAIILIDLRTKEWILVDEDVHGLPVSNGSKIFGIIQRVAELPKVSALDILKLHAEARGKIVAEKEDADTVWMFEDFSESYEKLLSFMI
jgi:hypothetical protein